MLASCVGLLPSVVTAEDAFIKIEGIKGESTVPGHKDEIEAIGFTSGVDRPLPYPGQEQGKPQFYEVRVSKKIDSASPLLFVDCATGKKYPKVILTLARPEPGKGGAKGEVFDYYTVTLSNVTITRVATGPSPETGAGGVRNEEVSLSFQKIEWKYIPVNSRTGKKEKEVEGSYDLATDKLQ